MIRAHRRLQLVAVMLSVLGNACGDAPNAPSSGTVRVVVRTSGGDVDFDGYEVVVAPARRSVDVNGTAEFRFIGAGEHTVVLDGVADNCVVVGTSTRSVAVARDRIIVVAFDVDCAATGIAVTTEASGTNIPDSVDVTAEDGSFSRGPANGVTLISRLRPGKNKVILALPGTNCGVAGGNEVTVDVVSRSVTPVRFELTCTAPVRTEKIAFAVDTTNRGAPETLIEVIDPDGTERRVIGRGRTPSWAPDGTRVAFSDARCGANDDGGFGCFGGLIVVDPELGNLTRPPYGNRGFNPAWAPAGDKLAFIGCCGDESLDPTRLFVGALDESVARELVLPASLPVSHPVWSPDGWRIAFTCAGDGALPGELAHGDLCVINADGSNFRRLTTTLASESDPAWSPDGTRIAFTLGTEVAVLQLGDGAITRLTEGREPAWSPDGSMLVFASSDGLFTIQADGSNRQRLTNGAHRSPAWRP